MTDKAPLVGDVTRDWCPVHLEPFRADWPRGAAIAEVLIIEAALSDPDIQKATTGGIDSLNAALVEFAPLCCQVERHRAGTVDRIVAVALGDKPGSIAELRDQIRREGGRA